MKEIFATSSEQYMACCGLAQKFRLIYHKNTD